MADEVKNTDVAPAVSPVETAPSQPAASPEVPSVEIAPAPAVEQIAVEPVKTDTAPVAEEKKPETILGGEKKIEEKPEEKKTEVPAEEKAPEVKSVEIPSYEPFKFPEGVTFDETKMGEFTKSLGEFETTSKAAHEEVQKLGQQMVERHIAEMQRYTESLTHAWNKQKEDWKDSFIKDPEFANRTDTVINSAIDAIGVYGGDSKQQGEFRELMESTGVGNHPAMIRLLSNVMLAKAEPKPLAAPQIAAKVPTSRIQKMYGKKSG